MNKRSIIALGALLTVATIGGSAIPAAATSNNGDTHKVTICHANNSATGKSGNQPYVRITVDINSIVHGAGHDGHDGPVASSLSVAQTLKDNHTKWGDIIPPIPSAHYAGANWTAEGQAVYNHSCSCPAGSNQVTPSSTDEDKSDTKTSVTPTATTPTSTTPETVTELPHTGMSQTLVTMLSLGMTTAAATAGAPRLLKLLQRR